MNNKIRLIFYVLLISFAAVIVFSGNFAVKERTATTFEFDTVCEITAYCRNDKPVRKSIDLLDKYNNMWSAEVPESEISRLNKGEYVTLSEETEELISYAESFERDNLFSIYLNSLVKVWDIKNNKGVIPDVRDALEDAENKRGINLGGIAKGYACDKVIESLKNDGIESALVNLGGNVYALGKKPTGEEWRIGIADPKNPDETIGSIRAENLSVVTSGNYQRFFEKDGKKYHHIFDPQTGMPADSGILSCTVIADSSALCDVLSTMIFVAGVEEGAKILQEYDALGIFITEDTIYFSKKLENIFKQNSFNYKYEFLL